MDLLANRISIVLKLSLGATKILLRKGKLKFKVSGQNCYFSKQFPKSEKWQIIQMWSDLLSNLKRSCKLFKREIMFRIRVCLILQNNTEMVIYIFFDKPVIKANLGISITKIIVMSTKLNNNKICSINSSTASKTK